MKTQTRNAIHDSAIVLIVFTLLAGFFLAVANGFATPWSPIGTDAERPVHTHPQPFTQTHPVVGA